MKSIVKPGILDINPYIPGKPIEEVKRELGFKKVIKLASNESPYGPSAKVLRAIRRAAKEVNRYPDGGCYHLRRVLAKRLKVKPQQLIFGNGSDEIIVMGVRAFVGRDDEVILAKPSFLIYEIASRVEGANIKAVPLNNFRYDLEGMKNAITVKTKIIFIGNPDNPAGSCLSHVAMECFLKDIPQSILVFIDEAYYEFVQAKDYCRSLELLKEYKNVLVTRTFSKMYGLAGLRIGYGIGDPFLIDILNRVREPFNINSIAQAAAAACLDDPKYYQRIAKEIKEQKKFLNRQLTKMGLSFVESWTNFILIDMKQNGPDIVNQLLKKGIIVRDMNTWGLDNYIRVTVGTSKENKQFVEALREVLS